MNFENGQLCFYDDDTGELLDICVREVSTLWVQDGNYILIWIYGDREEVVASIMELNRPVSVFQPIMKNGAIRLSTNPNLAPVGGSVICLN